MEKTLRLIGLGVRLASFVVGTTTAVGSAIYGEPLTLVVGVMLMFAAAELYGPLCDALLECVKGDES